MIPHPAPTDPRIPVAILGASGLTGQELARLLVGHPRLRLAAAMTSRPGVTPEPTLLPGGLAVEPLDVDRLGSCAGAFVCTPHGAAVPLVRAALERGCRVVDLSADLRLRDPAVHQATYGGDAALDLRSEAVYGLVERARPALRAARLVANPGCYVTSVLLPLLPVLEAGLLRPDAPIVADCKSGVSGAGKAPTDRTHFGNVHENFSAYNVGAHRHAPEIHQEAGTDRVVFVPHLLPVWRGILSTLYLPPAPGVRAEEVRACLAEAYAGERFVRVYARGQGLPDLAGVQRTNDCHLAVADAGSGVVVVVSALDNLVKGAAGQALQSMNLLLGVDEAAGLP